MKLLHLADLHLGRRVNEFDLLEDQRAILEQILALCEEKQVDTVLLAGDLYDKSVPSAEAVALLDWFLTALTAQKRTVVAIAGNHDSAARLDFGSRLLSAGGLYITGSFRGAPGRVVLSDAWGEVHIHALPFIKAATVAHYLPEADTSSYSRAVAAALAASPPDSSVRSVLLAHQFVTAGGQAPEASGSETALNVGTVDNVDVSCFDGYDYVALGHIHSAQRVGRDTVRYAGSPLKYSLSEWQQRKTAPLITLGAKGSVDYELLTLTPRRDMRHITGPMAELLDRRRVQDTDDYLWVTLTDEKPILDAMRQVKAVYPNTMKLDFAVRRNTAAPQMRVETMRAKSFEALFGEFYETASGAKPTEAEWALLAEAQAKIKEAQQ